MACREPALEQSSRPRPTAAAPPHEALWETGDAALDALSQRLRPLRDANRKTLVGRTGTIQGFGAGETYPQIWLRDSMTLLALTRFVETRPWLESWLLEHLAHQEASGALFDWIAAGEPAAFPYAPQARVVYRSGPLVVTADKNTSASDQETSAVLAAASVFSLLDDRAWLTRDVAGRPLLTRLDDALAFVRRERFDPRRGLVVSALTADWGDVSPTYGDQRAIYLDEATPRVASFYASALFFGAARALAGLHTAAGNVARAAHWESEAKALAAAADHGLWREKDGFFRMHAELEETGPHPPDGSILAMGGHAAAILHGLVDEARTARILRAAERRHEQYGLGTLAGTLLPPYPTGFFRHPILTREWTYQNGGLWDWFAGRLLTGLFEHGQSAAATRHLIAIARRVEASHGLYEWTDLQGKGRGSPLYAGSGAALGQAVIEGLFGVQLEAGAARVSVRLGGRNGRLRLQPPASSGFVDYEYRADLSARMLRLRVLARPALRSLELLLPDGLEATAVQVDGRAVAFTRRHLGNDRYARLDGALAGREVLVTLGRE